MTNISYNSSEEYRFPEPFYKPEQVMPQIQKLSLDLLKYQAKLNKSPSIFSTNLFSTAGSELEQECNRIHKIFCVIIGFSFSTTNKLELVNMRKTLTEIKDKLEAEHAKPELLLKIRKEIQELTDAVKWVEYISLKDKLDEGIKNLEKVANSHNYFKVLGLISALIYLCKKTDTDSTDLREKLFSSVSHDLQNFVRQQKEFHWQETSDFRRDWKQSTELIEKQLTKIRSGWEIIEQHANEEESAYSDLNFGIQGLITYLEKTSRELIMNVNETLEIRALRESVEKMDRDLRQPSNIDSKPIDLHLQNVHQLMMNATKELRIDHEELLKYGKKHAHLIMMNHLLKILQLDRVVVPVPHGLKSEEIESFLRNYAPSMFEHWENLANLYVRFENKDQFLKDPQVQMVLSEINTVIKQTFEKASLDPFIRNQLLQPELMEWLKEIKQNKDYLMVRSSGAEDSRKLANAGGNISCAYIPPEDSDLCQAIGKVIASYFSIASLQNRLNAKTNPFEEKLSIAVTVQQLIGEDIFNPTQSNVNPPISLVLFTSEPLYVGGELFRVMRICASYGHGEAVVGNMGINSDTVLVLVSQTHPDKLYVLYDNQPKPERLAPVMTEQHIELKRVPNDPSIQNRPTLTNTMLNKLFLSSVIMEKFFDDKPVDMEIVIKNNKIHIVQTRSVNRPELLPTYLNLKTIAELPKNPITQTIHGEMLVFGTGSALIINDRNKVLCAPTLANAERAFESENYQFVNVYCPEPPNSHPVVNFSHLGIPCLYTNKSGEVENLLNIIDSNYSLIVDIQRETMHVWDNQEGDVNLHISHGYAVHPAKIAISLPLAMTFPNLTPSIVPQEVLDLLFTLRCTWINTEALSLLKNLKEGRWVKQTKEKEMQLRQNMEGMRFIPHQALQVTNMLKSLSDKVDTAFHEAEVVFLKKEKERLNPLFNIKKEGERLHPLFHVKVIETLLIPTGQNTTGISQYTTGHVEPISQEILALIDYQKNFKHPVHFSEPFLLGSQALTPETAARWRHFLADLEFLADSGVILNDQIGQFKYIIEVLKKMAILPMWFTVFFSPQTNETSGRIFSNILNSLPQEELLFLENLLTYNQGLERSLEGQGEIEQLTSAENFNKGLAWLIGQAGKVSSQSTVFGVRSLTQQLLQGSVISSLATLKVMQNMVEVFDYSIKTMKASQSFSGREKVLQFKEMLIPFSELMLDWCEHLILPDSIPMHEKFIMKDYLTTMNFLEIRSLLNNIDQLFPSPTFNVASAMLGSCRKPRDIIRPKSLEDFFTLCHQNGKVILWARCNKIINKIDTKYMLLPKLFEYALNLLTDGKTEKTYNIKIEKTAGTMHPESIARIMLRSFDIKIVRDGLDFDEKMAVVKFSIPLRSHSSMIKIEYDKNKNQVTWQSTLLGENEYGRWHVCYALLESLDHAGL
nr:hypothetical protein [Parachlamydiaceae bacterium]